MTNPDNLVPKLARTEIFYFAARVCMLGATLIGLPICAVMLSRAVASADEIAKQVSVQSVQLQLLSNEVKIRLDNDGRTITDHELRLRQMERGK